MGIKDWFKKKKKKIPTPSGNGGTIYLGGGVGSSPGGLVSMKPPKASYTPPKSSGGSSSGGRGSSKGGSSSRGGKTPTPTPTSIKDILDKQNASEKKKQEDLKKLRQQAQLKLKMISAEQRKKQMLMELQKAEREKQKQILQAEQNRINLLKEKSKRDNASSSSRIVTDVDTGNKIKITTTEVDKIVSGKKIKYKIIERENLNTGSFDIQTIEYDKNSGRMIQTGGLNYGKGSAKYIKEERKLNQLLAAEKTRLSKVISSGILTQAEGQKIYDAYKRGRIREFNKKFEPAEISGVVSAKEDKKFRDIFQSIKSKFTDVKINFVKYFNEADKDLERLYSESKLKREDLNKELKPIQEKRAKELKKIDKETKKKISNAKTNKEKVKIYEDARKKILEIKSKYDKKGIKLQNKILQETGKSVALSSAKFFFDVTKFTTGYALNKETRKNINTTIEKLATDKKAQQNAKKMIKEEWTKSVKMIRTNPGEAMISIGGDIIIMSAVSKGFKPIAKIAKKSIKGSIKIAGKSIRKIAIIDKIFKMSGKSIRLIKKKGNKIIRLVTKSFKKKAKPKIKRTISIEGLKKQDKINKLSKKITKELQKRKGVKLNQYEEARLEKLIKGKIQELISKKTPINKINFNKIQSKISLKKIIKKIKFKKKAKPKIKRTISIEGLKKQDKINKFINKLKNANLDIDKNQLRVIKNRLEKSLNSKKIKLQDIENGINKINKLNKIKKMPELRVINGPLKNTKINTMQNFIQTGKKQVMLMEKQLVKKNKIKIIDLKNQLNKKVIQIPKKKQLTLKLKKQIQISKQLQKPRIRKQMVYEMIFGKSSKINLNSLKLILPKKIYNLIPVKKQIKTYKKIQKHKPLLKSKVKSRMKPKKKASKTNAKPIRKPILKSSVKTKIKSKTTTRPKPKKKDSSYIKKKRKKLIPMKTLTKPQMTYKVYVKRRGKNVLLADKLIETDAKNFLAYNVDTTLLRSAVIKPQGKLKRVRKISNKYVGAFNKRAKKFRKYKIQKKKKKPIRGYIEKRKYSADTKGERKQLSRTMKKAIWKKKIVRKKKVSKIKNTKKRKINK